ncbi:MAG: large subunit ribosomal protein L18e [Archaeoglobaceae archaeon]|nr:large subunit ribosomal protein L18e [Archaeoglobaceae archaeon]MDK2876439.1 large subunit ribosomal protein L18e [Archaeoglobaceae archaeon]
MSKIRNLQKRKTNPRLVNLIDLLLRESAKNDAKVWKCVAEKLAGPTKKWAEVSLDKIEKFAKDGEYVVVPGKVLGGEIRRPLKVAAFSFSATAKAKIKEAGGDCLSIEELLKINPSGKGVRIII